MSICTSGSLENHITSLGKQIRKEDIFYTSALWHVSVSIFIHTPLSVQVKIEKKKVLNLLIVRILWLVEIFLRGSLPFSSPFLCSYQLSVF